MTVDTSNLRWLYTSLGGTVVVHEATNSYRLVAGQLVNQVDLHFFPGHWVIIDRQGTQVVEFTLERAQAYRAGEQRLSMSAFADLPRYD